MTWYHFFGQLLPPDWTLSEHEIRTSEGSSVRFAGANGILSVQCVLPDSWSLNEARNRVEATIRTAAAAYGFVDRSSFSIRITGYATANGNGGLDGRFGGLPSTGLDKAQLMELAVVKHPGLGVALVDYSAAIDTPLETPFYAYRAVEVIRALVTGEPSGASPRWDAMHQQLHTTKEFFAPLTNLSQTTRHGHLREVSESQRATALIAAATAIERAVEWLRQEPRTPLPIASFPQLSTPPVWLP